MNTKNKLGLAALLASFSAGHALGGAEWGAEAIIAAENAGVYEAYIHSSTVRGRRSYHEDLYLFYKEPCMSLFPGRNPVLYIVSGTWKVDREVLIDAVVCCIAEEEAPCRVLSLLTP